MTETIQRPYTTVTLQGTPYQIGCQQGESLKQIPGWVNFLGSCAPEWSQQHYAEAKRLYEQFCPGLNEEIQGLTDTIGISPDRLIYHFFTYLLPPRCSHFVLLPDQTANGHSLHGRSYEFNIETNDNRFCLTRPQGKHAHYGNTSLLLGRLDGMNENGLVVTMTAGGIPIGNTPELRPPVQQGLQFWVVVRSLLENCKDVSEALDWLKEIPCGGNPILMLSDSQGQAARVEIYGAKKSIRSVEAGYLTATNHFSDPEMEPHNGFVMANSPMRAKRIQSWIEEHSRTAGMDEGKQLLSAKYPQGLCCHYYAETFGTLHSMLFDPQAKEIQICFGSPAENGWYSYDFRSGDIPGKEYMVSFPQETAPASFWR
ncbi:MAG TPA: C45 family peptidase [Longilinea sp.]|nr:C45 family peptidase [Longilinea sp.]